MADAISVHYRAGASSSFPQLPVDMPVIRIAIDPADIDENDDIVAFDIVTNLGADLSPTEGMRAVGYALHRLAHALLSTNGFILDMHDLEHPENAAGGAS